ncbi:Membrane fusion protein, cobalt-zinc-cadmium efflux system [Beijerinckiaceae bacterium RH CH11]|nr:Membrane fusion protein, cobalt-zinc-cadmium efflux system [Beijerinckiaceae bacterium RH CH11]VVB46791.1 Membrane fusion protein, cobalt-zinc-cadmium efflux system [Beijerinckiaceae bacterium RH AL8]
MPKSKTALVASALAVGLALGGWALWTSVATAPGHAAAQTEKSGSEKPATDPDVLHVDAHARAQLGLREGRAATKEIVKSIEVPGTVAFDDRKVAHIKPRTKGRVLSLAVRPGDVVERGAVLAVLDAAGVLDAYNGLQAARASLGEAKASRDAAAIAVTRAAALLKIGGVARAELERRQVEAAKAQAAVESAQAQVDLYAAQYGRLAPAHELTPGTSEIVTPIRGVVVSQSITLGEVIDTSQDAFTVADPSKMLVLASLFGFDVDAVKTGDRAVISAAIGRDARFDAHVVSISAALDPLTNAVAARLEVENPRGTLKANMFVTVAIEADLGRRGVTIPAAAVQITEQGPIAFVQTSDDTFQKRALTLGLQQKDWVEVKKGIADGDTVVTDGSFGLKAMLLRSLLGSTD